jgi:hypothetical protein
MATDKGQKDKQRSTKHNTVWMIGVLRGNKLLFNVMTWFTNKAKIKVTLSDYKGILNIQNSWKLIKIFFLSMNEWSLYKM